MNIRYRLAAVSGTVAVAAMSAALLHNSGSPPNIELLMTFIIASGLALGPLAGFAGAIAMRFLYDLFIAWPGPWTPVTALCFGITGLIAGLLPAFAGRKSFSRIQMAAIAVALTLAYDALTLVAFSVMFRLPLLSALGPQIPFTINHVLGNALFAFAFLPLLTGVLSKAVALDAQEARQPSPARFKL